MNNQLLDEGINATEDNDIGVGMKCDRMRTDSICRSLGNSATVVGTNHRCQGSYE